MVIGAEGARQLAAEGASVVVNYASSKAGADKVVADIAARGGKAVAVKGDVSKKADAEGIISSCEPTAHRGVRKVVLPPPSCRAEWLRAPPAAAWSGVG